MRINIVQYSPSRDVKENYERIRELIDKSAEMIVLPELSDYGYFVDRSFLEKRDTSQFPLMMQALSKELGKTLIFGAVNKEGKKYYNSLYCVENGRVVGIYKKIHLTDYEKKTFFAGSQCMVFTLESGLRIAPSICFDLWFPEIYRDYFIKEVDLFVTAAAFGGPRSLEIASVRSAENSRAMVLANRAGFEDFEGSQESFLGRSRFISYFGETLKEGRVGDVDSFSYDLPLLKRNSNVICSDMREEIMRHYHQ